MDRAYREFKEEKGFTLVELAIVMIIIGLLITGILKGQEMIANAQITSTVSQIKGIDAATSTFRDMYDALPGDMVNPDVRLPGCTGTVCTEAGDGNSRVDDVDPDEAPDDDEENLVFFTHLAAADLLNGVSPEPDTGTINFGDELPETDIGASGYFVGFTGDGNPGNLIGPAMRGGHYLGIAASPTADMGTTAGAEALTPSQAARIDRKLDDGQPNAGAVRAGGNATCVDATAITGNYQETVDQNNCNLFIRIQG